MEESNEKKVRKIYNIDIDDAEGQIQEEPVAPEEPEEEEEREPLQLTGEPEDVAALRAELEELESQLQEERQATEREHNQYLRALADFNNYRRRHQEEYAKHLELANQEIILKLLPVIDNFERASRAAEETHDFEALAKGVDLVLKQLHDILEREGVRPIEAVGQEFDPNLHEAMMRVETDEYPENTIVEEFERGYLHKDHVIRPSRVKVATKG